MALCNIISVVESAIQPDMQYKELIVYISVYMYAFLCMGGWKAHPFVWAKQEEVNVLTDNAQRRSFTVNI